MAEYAKGGIINTGGKSMVTDEIPEFITHNHPRRFVYWNETKRKYAEMLRVRSLDYLFDQRD